MNLLGKGIYSYGECARLLGISGQKVRAWYRGWPRGSDALIQSEYEGMFENPVVSFLDFVDAAVALTLNTKHGITVQTIRKLRKTLSEDWDTLHPFAIKDFYTDPNARTVFISIAEEDGKQGIVDILKKQRVFPRIMLPFLEKVEYDEDTKLAQVFPLIGKVILDPRRKYGKPIVRGTGMATVLLFECYKVTGSEDEVADWYNVTAEDVIEAVRFETEFSGYLH